MKKIKKIGKNSLFLFVIPAITYIIFYILCEIQGVSGFGVGTDLTVIIRNSVYSGFIALAVSYNLTTGRFDFSVGSVLVLSTILGGMMTLRFSFGPIGLLFFSLLFGAILSGMNGLLYTILRIPPMVVSLGVAMIYEAVGFVVSSGGGIKLIGRNDLLIWAKQPYIFIILIVIVGVLIVVLNFTRFGYNANALRTGQETAVKMGIDEKRNTLIAYVISGVCLAAAGIINLSVLGTTIPVLSLGSIAYIQGAFMPMFIGGLLAKYADRNVGVIIGALTQSIIFAGIGRLGVPSAWQSVITGVIVLGFFGYAFNAYKITEFKMFKEKRQLALQNQEATT